MKSSVSARVNAVVAESGQLVAMCEKAEQLIGDREHPGVADQINNLMKKLEQAKKPIHEMMVGSEEGEEETAQAAALPPFLVAMLPPLKLSATAASDAAERKRRARDGRYSSLNFL